MKKVKRREKTHTYSPRYYIQEKSKLRNPLTCNNLATKCTYLLSENEKKKRRVVKRSSINNAHSRSHSSTLGTHKLPILELNVVVKLKAMK